MKTTAGRMTLITALTVLLISGINVARADEFKKYVERRFDVDKNATVSITNKFGAIHCEVWTESAVSIKVEITVESSSQEKADKVFDRITVELTGDRTNVNGTTEVGNMSFNSSEFSIDYYIMMPRTLNIDLDNSFGEIYVDETDGSAKIHLEYGELEINALNGPKSDITMRFSEGSTDYLNEGNVDIEYSELSIEGANNLDVRTRFSELDIEKMGALILDSQYDDISLGTTAKVNITSRFSDVEVDRLNGNFTIDCEYGSFDAGYIFAGFSEGLVMAAFSGVSLSFDPAASFMVSAEMKFCSLSYPSSGASISHSEENYVTNLYKGVIGSNKSTTASLVIESQNGDVEISY